MGTLLSGANTGLTGVNSILSTLFPAQGTPGSSGYIPATTIGSLFGKLFGGGGSNPTVSTDTSGQTVYELPDGSKTTDQTAYEVEWNAYNNPDKTVNPDVSD
jgi:hypothetical protein